jgi:hypothetical protein
MLGSSGVEPTVVVFSFSTSCQHKRAKRLRKFKIGNHLILAMHSKAGEINQTTDTIATA